METTMTIEYVEIEGLTLDQLVEKFYSYKAAADSNKNISEVYKKELLARMEKADLKEYASTEFGLTAQVTTATTIKYENEDAIIKYLKDNGYRNFVKESIRTTDLNKALKGTSPLTEGLSKDNLFHKVDIKKLSVSKND